MTLAKAGYSTHRLLQPFGLDVASQNETRQYSTGCQIATAAPAGVPSNGYGHIGNDHARKKLQLAHHDSEFEIATRDPVCSHIQAITFRRQVFVLW